MNSSTGSPGLESHGRSGTAGGGPCSGENALYPVNAVTFINAFRELIPVFAILAGTFHEGADFEIEFKFVNRHMYGRSSKGRGHIDAGASVKTTASIGLKTCIPMGHAYHVYSIFASQSREDPAEYIRPTVWPEPISMRRPVNYFFQTIDFSRPFCYIFEFSTSVHFFLFVLPGSKGLPEGRRLEARRGRAIGRVA